MLLKHSGLDLFILQTLILSKPLNEMVPEIRELIHFPHDEVPSWIIQPALIKRIPTAPPGSTPWKLILNNDLVKTSMKPSLPRLRMNVAF